MNKAILSGRLTKDPDIRTTASGISVCSFTIACNRRVKNSSGEWVDEADFIPCVAWRQLGEHVNRYFNKGDRILVEGEIRPRSYEDKKTGERRYITEVIVSNVEFAQDRAKTKAAQDDEDFVDIDDTSLPFDF